MSNELLCIESVSTWDTCRIHLMSFVFGVWMLCKRAVGWVWNPNGYKSLQLHDNPPSCLMDSSLGQHKYVKLKGVKLHYVESGSKDQPVMLLLHGFPDCWLSWRHQIPVLSTYFRVIALDLKGFGDSDKPMWRSSYRIDIILQEIKQFTAALGIKKCMIVGHDLGAFIGWYLVHQMPNIVTKFFAVSCPHPNVYWNNVSQTYTNQWLNFVQMPYLPEMDALKEDVKIISQYHKHLSAQDVYLEAYKYTFSRKEDWTGPINYFRNLPFHKISDHVDQIETTVILIVGSQDEFVKLDNIVRSTEYCERFYMKIIDGGQHFPHQEKADEFNSVILKYAVTKKSGKTQNNGEIFFEKAHGGTFRSS
ncbi:hypothetical protein NQ318_023083 [Aromia moschata]|uniref:AB hydrolase-1 domain-containing protein n=1 Tax=Aromia moschata TaxID=1265417 RepID=A0AAV8XLQ1_9CUCU|nr:hypothetical protein NQ318_023083 [Aromia moschata]